MDLKQKKKKNKVKPANPLPFIILLSISTGLSTKDMSGNWANNLSDKPLFIEALILMILVRPSVVRCAPCLIK